MLGSRKKCSNCHGTSFRRVKVNRTIQCESCKLILEERCISDLSEYHAITQTEEVHCVVAPDHLHSYLVDDIPNDPYCTPGFISGFRMLSPLREPIYAASARTLSGSLAEMERIIGDALFAGYVGYNGRAPGSAVKKEEVSETGERSKSGGDARHTLVAYFEIVELASILCVDRETANLAIRTFRHTANNTSLRNRNVESLATAAFVSAAERRWHEYQEWVRRKSGTPSSEEENAAEVRDKTLESQAEKEWPTPPRQLSVEEISAAANLDAGEVLRYLKVVNVALRKQRPENSSSITTHMPTFCRRLDLPQKTRRLAIGIAEKAMQNNICSRRNPISISAAAIYLACQLDGIRKTQTEICRATTLTEVTLRKVYKELNREHAALIPDWYQQQGEQNESEQVATEGERPFARFASRMSAGAQEEIKTEERDEPSGTEPKETSPSSAAHKQTGIALVPPPLPPGFGDNHAKAKGPEVPATTGLVLPSQPSPTPSGGNPMLAMLSNPAMQAFANAFSMMPQLMPPPPPPLPIPQSAETVTDQTGQGSASKQDADRLGGTAPEPLSTEKDNVASGNDENINLHQAQEAQEAILAQSSAPSAPPTESGQPVQSAAGDLMIGMVQAMQAFQAMQRQAVSSQSRSEPAEQLNPFAMVAMAMAQAQKSGVSGAAAETAGQRAHNSDPSSDPTVQAVAGNDTEASAEGGVHDREKGNGKGQ